MTEKKTTIEFSISDRSGVPELFCAISRNFCCYKIKKYFYSIFAQKFREIAQQTWVSGIAVEKWVL